MGIWSRPTFFLKDLETFRLQIIVEGPLQSLCANFEASRVKGDRVAPKEWEVKQEQKPGIKALPVAQSSWFWNMFFISLFHTRISLFHNHHSLLKLRSFWLADSDEPLKCQLSSPTERMYWVWSVSGEIWPFKAKKENFSKKREEGKSIFLNKTLKCSMVV